MPNIAENIIRVRESVRSQAQKANRDPSGVTLLAVSKLQPAEAILTAFGAGQRDFGENYVQEALAKMDQLADLPVTWHFIGALQSNKTRDVAERFQWVHTVDRTKLGQRLAAQRPSSMPPLNVCLQVNIDREDSKAGCAPEDVLELAQSLANLSALRLRGLMAIPAPGQGAQAFIRLSSLMQTLNVQCNLELDTLSMGMSDDMEEAISAGATIVRVGTAIFGARPPRTPAAEV